MKTLVPEVKNHDEYFNPNSSETITSDLQNPEPSPEKKIDPVVPLSVPPIDGSSEENLDSEKTPQITGESQPNAPSPNTLKKEPVVNIVPNLSNTSIPTSTVSHMPHSPFPPSIAKVLSYTGAHGTQINASPEDMEFNRIIDSNPRADFSSLPSITSTILKSIQTSVTASLQDRFEHSKFLASSVFVSASSISGDEITSESKQTDVVKGPTKTELLQDVSTATLEQKDEEYEVNDGTTLYLKEEPTNPTKDPQTTVSSSFVSNPSILSSQLVSEDRGPRQHLVDRDIVPTQLNDIKLGIENNDTNIPVEDIRKNIPLHSEVEDQHVAIQPTQVVHDQQYASSNIEILPSAVMEHESKPEIPTPALEETGETAEIIQEDSFTKELTETHAQEQHISTEMSNQHVSTESDTHSIEIKDTNFANVEEEIKKTVEYKPSGSDLHPVKNTPIPSLNQHTSKDSEPETDTYLSSEHETISGGTEESNDNDSGTMQENLNQDNYDSEDLGEDDDHTFEDFEDEEQDDEGVESEDIKEHRKKIVEESLQNAKENEEVATPSEPPTLNDAVQNGEEGSDNIEFHSDEGNTNVVEDSFSTNERNEEKEMSNEDKEPLGISFGGVNEENGKELKVENINTNSETYLGNEINDEHLDSPSESELLNDIEISTKASIINEGIADTLKKPGDDIKFYEPGDMIPLEPSLASSDHVISDHAEDSMHQKNSDNLEAVTETFNIEENTDGKLH